MDDQQNQNEAADGRSALTAVFGTGATTWREQIITGGFGIMMDLERRTMRQWVMGRDGVKRWADNGTPTDGSCAECGANDADQAATMCICSGDKDHCNGCDLWPD